MAPIGEWEETKERFAEKLAASCTPPRLRVRVDPPPIYFEVDISWPGMADKCPAEQEDYAIQVARERYRDLLRDSPEKLEPPRDVRIADE